MNKLDDKVIIDRELLESLSHCLMEIQGPRRDAINAAIASDLTGWVAVPVVFSDGVLEDAKAIAKSYAIDTEREDPWGDAVCYAHFHILEVSPQLPGGGK